VQDADADALGQQMHALARELFPICRSLTGDGVRETLSVLGKHLPLERHEVPSGTSAFDWIVPREWNVREAFIEDEPGHRIVDFKKHNLHLMGYSTPIDAWLSLAELQEHLYSLEDQPDAIPYVTSYYKERWGFCVTHRQRTTLKDGRYHVRIDSELRDGHLSYADFTVPGETPREVLVTTYVCHPSMANNELSGPVVATFLAKWVMAQTRRFTYRFVFVPETIGSIVYLNRNLAHLKHRMEVGFNLSCIGDERGYSYVASRYENTLADRIARHVLRSTHPEFVRYSFLERGSDERQYSAPGVDLPLVTLCRTKFGQYPEYHTSLDDLTLVTAEGLAGGYEFARRCLEVAEQNHTYRVKCLCEPQLGRRGLYSTVSTRDSWRETKSMTAMIAYADGSNDLLSIAERLGVPSWDLDPIARRLVDADLFAVVDSPMPASVLRV
jgi:aminopeptidase-like protein